MPEFPNYLVPIIKNPILSQGEQFFALAGVPAVPRNMFTDMDRKGTDRTMQQPQVTAAIVPAANIMRARALANSGRPLEFVSARKGEIDDMLEQQQQ